MARDALALARALHNHKARARSISHVRLHLNDETADAEDATEAQYEQSRGFAELLGALPRVRSLIIVSVEPHEERGLQIMGLTLGVPLGVPLLVALARLKRLKKLQLLGPCTVSQSALLR